MFIYGKAMVITAFFTNIFVHTPMCKTRVNILIIFLNWG